MEEQTTEEQNSRYEVVRFQSVKRTTISPDTENNYQNNQNNISRKQLSALLKQNGGEEDNFVAQPDRHDGVEAIVASVFVNSRR